MKQKTKNFQKNQQSKRSVLKIKDEIKAEDAGAIHLFYIQAAHNVVHSNYPCDVPTAIKLAGLQLHITVGNFNPEIHKAGYLL